MRTLHTALILSSLTGLAMAQSAAATVYGTGCSYNGLQLGISAQGLPQIGTTFSIEYSGPNLNNTLSIQPVLVLGTLPDASPIPPSFLPQQPANCTAWIVPLFFNPMPQSALGDWETSLSIVVPNDPGLIGLSFYAQWMSIVIQCGIVPPCWFEALPTSDGLQLDVGL